MASTCPKCHRVLDEDEVCCAQVHYTWRCRTCFKVSRGTAVPYGKCFMCGGELEILPDRDLPDGMRFKAVRDAVQFELEFFNFYKHARQKAIQPEQAAVLEWLYDIALGHLYDLESVYHVCLNREMVEIASDEERFSHEWPFGDIEVKENSAVQDVMKGALELERRLRDHFRELARDAAAGIERDLCRELEAEADEDMAFLETGLDQVA